MASRPHDLPAAPGGGDRRDRPRVEQALCDPESGVCALPAPASRGAAPSVERTEGEVLYVGDPMCSWCWGASPGLRELEAEALRRRIPFRVLVGGLRPGGGEPWTSGFRRFLRNHWEEIGARTGQPFSTRFLDRASFDYDTEPACRAFVVLRTLLDETPGPATRAYAAFAAIQRRFYAEGEDPTVTSFYQGVCAELGLDFASFRSRFEGADARRRTQAEFEEVRALGVRGFPTVLYRGDAGLEVLASGYATGARLTGALAAALAAG